MSALSESSSTASAGANHRSLSSRLLLALLGGAGASALAAGLAAPWQVVLLAAWDGIAVAFITQVWLRLAGYDGEQTRRHATREDESRAVTHVLLLSASVVSLVAVADELAEASNRRGWTEIVFVAVAVVTVFASWAVIHTLYALRYADLYYTEPVGGIDFFGDVQPDYGDFAYVAFTVGMTFQVSDTNVSSGRVRRAILAQALLSFVFGAFIVALTINIVAGLFNR